MDVNGFVVGMGALAEMLGVYRDALLKNGFSREEALGLVADYALLVLEGAIGIGGDDGAV